MLKTSASALAIRPHHDEYDDTAPPRRTGEHRNASVKASENHAAVILQDAAPGTSPGPYLRMRIGSGPVRTAGPIRVSLPPVDRLGRSEARLLAATIACAVVFSGVLIIYLTAYAQVTLFGIRQAHNRVELRDKRLLNETLRAQCAALESPNRIEAKATAMGMVIETRRVCYIEPGESPTAIPKHSSVQVALAPGD